MIVTTKLKPRQNSLFKETIQSKNIRDGYSNCYRLSFTTLKTNTTLSIVLDVCFMCAKIMKTRSARELCRFALFFAKKRSMSIWLFKALLMKTLFFLTAKNHAINRIPVTELQAHGVDLKSR